jgi:hypothetical protein
MTLSGNLCSISRLFGAIQKRGLNNRTYPVCVGK